MNLKKHFVAEIEAASAKGHTGSKAVVVALGAMGLTLGQNAMAALPTGIDTSLAAVQTDALAMADLVWPVVIALFGSVVLFKLFKRYASKI